MGARPVHGLTVTVTRRHQVGSTARGPDPGDPPLSDADIVIPKTERDAFVSSSLPQVLNRLGRNTLLLVGGFARGCLGRTANSALQAGYRCVVVRDATFDKSTLVWPLGLAEVPYSARVDTWQLVGEPNAVMKPEP